MDSTKQMLTGWKAQTVMVWSLIACCSPLGPGFITGQRTKHSPLRDSIVSRPHLACCALGALCGARLLGFWLAEGVVS